MTLNGFIPYDKRAARLYDKRRWWLGLTLGGMFDKVSDVYPTQEALVCGDKRYTYEQLRGCVDRMAFSLLEAGLRPGDRVLLQLPNWPEFVILYFACHKAGLIIVLLTVNHTVREILHLADLTEPKAWIAPAQYRKTDFHGRFEGVRQKYPDLKVIAVGEEVPTGCIRYDDLFNTGADVGEIRALLERVSPEPTDVCQILPSGGTTGLPKGAPRTHSDYLCNVEYKSRAWHLNVTDTCLVATTVGHNLALLVCVTGPIFHGAKVVMLDSTYPQDFCQIVQDEKVTCTGLVPTLMGRVASFDRLAEYDLSSLNRIYVGAAYSSPELVRQVEEKIGCRYINAFGMVEGPCSQTRPDAPMEMRCATIGRPVCPYDEFVTLDLEGKRTAPGVEGELAAKGPGIFTGYINNPNANKDAFTADGYFRTGDLAVIDKAGIIRITGRIKDIIIRGGENIAAQEVEELISSHPLVETVSVVGMPHAELGEDVCAYIQPVPGATISHAEVIDHLQKVGASRLFFPARTEFVNQLPLTAAGKVDKKVLRADIAEKQRVEAEPR